MEVSSASELAKEAVRHANEAILSQLQDFASRGLIEIQMTVPVFVQVVNPIGKHTFSIQQGCRLVLKDKEYIEKLEKENKELKNILERIHSVI